MADPAPASRLLITGAGGFVGRHVLQVARDAFPAIEVIATARQTDAPPALNEKSAAGPAFSPDRFEILDLTDADGVANTIRRVKPTHVLHLAGVASPGDAARDRKRAWQVNVEGTLTLAYAIKEHCPDAWLLNVGSGLVYGTTANDDRPLTERSLLAPTDEYGVTKAAADLALGSLASGGFKCLRFRPFNHTGPGQTTDYVVPAFAAQLAAIARGETAPVVKAGNLDAQRDFLDVRDVARAYLMAVQHTDHLQSGTIFNVASGTARSIQSILDRLIALAGVEVRVETDPARQRPSSVPVFVGDATRLSPKLGWAAQISLDKTLTDVLNTF